MDEMTKENMWIKGAVEHHVLELQYDNRDKKEVTVRRVHPDTVRHEGRSTILWATWCYLRRTGPRKFLIGHIDWIRWTDDTFDPAGHGQWEDMVPIYNRRNLKDKHF